MKSFPQTDKGEFKELLKEGALWSGERAACARGADVCAQIPALSFGAIHEWSLKEQLGGRRSFHPPLLMICAAIRGALAKQLGAETSERKTVLWIGERCWPTVATLERLGEAAGWNWRKNSILINSNSKEQRIYALRKALASPAVLAVVGDASGLSATATRQLQFSARAGETLGLLIRPHEELHCTSCSQTKWSVEPYLSVSNETQKERMLAHTGDPQWTVRLLRAPGLAAPRAWKLEWDDERFEPRELIIPQTTASETPEADVAYAG